MDVVQGLELVHEAEGLEGALPVELDHGLGDHGEFGGVNGDVLAFELLADRLQGVGSGVDFQGGVFDLDVLGAGVDGDKGELLGSSESGVIMMTPLESKFQATEPDSPRLPPLRVRVLRTSATVRFLLSVTA